MIQYLHSIRKMIGPLLDAIPHPVFLVNEDVVIIGLNRMSQQMVGIKPKLIIRRRAGEILHCIHSTETEKGCGYSDFCDDCIIRNSVNKSFKEHTTIRENVKMEINSNNGFEEIFLSIITSPFEYQEKSFVLMQFEIITELMDSRKTIPICCVCHNIRNDSDCWQQMESYFHKYLNLKFTHGICSQCEQKLYSELDKYKRGN